jgi:hypothetical protein
MRKWFEENELRTEKLETAQMVDLMYSLDDLEPSTPM